MEPTARVRDALVEVLNAAQGFLDGGDAQDEEERAYDVELQKAIDTVVEWYGFTKIDERIE